MLILLRRCEDECGLQNTYLDLVSGPVDPGVDLSLLEEASSHESFGGSLSGNESCDCIAFEERSLRCHKDGNLTKRRQLLELHRLLPVVQALRKCAQSLE